MSTEMTMGSLLCPKRSPRNEVSSRTDGKQDFGVTQRDVHVGVLQSTRSIDRSTRHVYALENSSELVSEKLEVLPACQGLNFSGTQDQTENHTSFCHRGLTKVSPGRGSEEESGNEPVRHLEEYLRTDLAAAPQRAKAN